MKHKELRYFYARLSPKEKNVFDVMYNGIKQRKSSFSVDLAGVDVGKVRDALHYDCPELFNLKSWALSYTDTRISFSEENPFIYSEAEEREINERIQNMVLDFPCDMDDFEIELAVHSFITRKCVYDRSYKKRNPNAKIHAENYSLVGPLIHGRGVCSGLARAAQYLFMELGIQAVFCSGILRDRDGEGLHAWLIVKIHGEYYHLDISNDVCASENSTIPMYEYFNLTDREIRKNHEFDSKVYTLPCVSEKFNYYKKHGLYFQSLDSLKRKAEEKLKKAGEYSTSTFFTFRMAENIQKEQVINALRDVMQKNKRIRSFTHTSGVLNTFFIEFALE